MVKAAKEEGLPVTGEVCPHHFILSEDDILENNGQYKMNPPLRSREDMQALIQGVVDGTVDVIATDHAPHSKEEKSKGLSKSEMGVVGLETSFGVLYSRLVLTGVITLERLINMMSVKPREIFNLPGGRIAEGEVADLALLDLDEEWTVDSNDFVSMGKATPFDGWKLQGKNVLTICKGEIVYEAL